MGQLVELRHPLARHHLTLLREASTPPSQVRAQVRRLTLLLTYEATAHLPGHPVQIRTPLAATDGIALAGRIGLVPILRAGLGMVDAALELLPQAEVWPIGLYRDETTHEPQTYYRRFEGPAPETVLILDPMLATGGSLVETLRQVKAWGTQRIAVLVLIAAPEGIETLKAAHPEIDLFTCAVDTHLDEKAYIIPGLGDAGDRLFGT